MHKEFPAYRETKQILRDIPKQNHLFMECQHLEKHSSFSNSMRSFCFRKYEDL